MVLELLLSDVPETSYTLNSELDLWARRLSVGKPRFAARHQPAAGRLAPGDCGEPRRLHPVRPLRARLPRRTGQRRHRLRLPRLGLEDRVDLDDPMGESTCVACGECVPGVPDRRAACPRARSGRSSPTSRWSRSARTAASDASSPTTSRPTRFSSCRARTARPTRAGCASRAATASTTCSTSIASPAPLIRKPGAVKHKDFHRRSDNWSDVFREATWEEALDFAANGLRVVRDTYGKKSLAGFGSAKGTNEEAYLFQKLVRTGIRLEQRRSLHPALPRLERGRPDGRHQLRAPSRTRCATSPRQT